jgi:hypothetical protein
MLVAHEVPMNSDLAQLHTSLPRTIFSASLAVFLQAMPPTYAIKYIAQKA